MTKAQVENHPDTRLLKACKAQRAKIAGG